MQYITKTFPSATHIIKARPAGYNNYDAIKGVYPKIILEKIDFYNRNGKEVSKLPPNEVIVIYIL
jgi:hypothetical protein